MKIKIIYTLFIAAFFAFVFISSSGGRAGSAGWGNTGAPGDETVGGNPQTCITCHESPNFDVDLTIDVLDDMGNSIVSAGYNPGESYTVKVSINATQGTPAAYGFQILCLNAPEGVNGDEVSNWSEPASNVKIATANFTGRTYAEHNGPSDTNEFTVKWEAPAEGSGIVTFYSCGNGVNLNGSNGDDGADCTILELEEATISSVPDLRAMGVQMSVFPNPVESDLQVDFQLENPASYRLDIIDLSGKVLKNQILNFDGGRNIISVNPEQLAPGLYYVRLSNEEGILTKKFIKK